ncbi:MAG TPA: pectate lyase [Paraburkholderia sp.]|uniref:pectate lyase family protein n=1 Tax=Burkholderia pyrrocinia TaxID=60550 RepID=UPI000B7072E5|nr:pectate lyase [Burkholderia territorii]HDR9504218.1 pectate lyase [Burkholderia cepacia]HKT97163.1 pectate lyase [Paraburkholderia sp.]
MKWSIAISTIVMGFLAGASVAVAGTGGFSTATGSSEGAVTVTSLTELQAAFDARKHHILVFGTLHGGHTPTTLTFASPDWSNTTIEGASGGKATLENIQLKFDGEMLPTAQNIENVVIRNITFRGVIADLQALPAQVYGTSNNVGINYEGISLRRVTNAWIDHCTFYDMSDDLMSVSLSSDNVTISYNRFFFTNAWLNMKPDPLWNWVGAYQDLANERLAMVIGANRNDSYMYGGNALHVTLHHNHFGPNLKSRPLLRGWVHAYDNFFDNSTRPKGLTPVGGDAMQYNALQIGSGGVVFAESNYYYMTRESNRVGLDSASDYYDFHERGNYYDQTTQPAATGTAFLGSPVNYSYSVDPVMNVPGLVQGHAGPH